MARPTSTGLGILCSHATFEIESRKTPTCFQQGYASRKMQRAGDPPHITGGWAASGVENLGKHKVITYIIILFMVVGWINVLQY